MSVHTLIVGDTGSGKSRSMREVIIPSWLQPTRFGLRRPPRPVAVCDPQLKPWPGCWVTASLEEWIETLKRSRQCVAVYDECGNECESDWHTAQKAKWAAAQSRNWGHLVYFIGNRAKQMPPTIRNQCGTVIAFHQNGQEDRAILAANYGDEFWDANTLTVGECLVKRPMQRTVKTRFFAG